MIDLQNKFFHSTSKIVRIVKKVDEFLIDPEHFCELVLLLEWEFEDEVVMPNAFIYNRNRAGCSLDAEKILLMGVALIQNGLQAIFMRQHLIKLKEKYKNKKERDKLVHELLEMVVFNDNKIAYKIFDAVCDLKGDIILDFSSIAMMEIIKAKILYTYDMV